MKAQGGYKKTAYNQVAIELQAAAPGLRLSAEQVYSEVDYFKKKWRLWMILVENSGFGWDPVTCLHTAPDAVWDTLIKENKDLFQFRYKTLPYLELMEQVFQDDRGANGNAALTLGQLLTESQNPIDPTLLNSDDDKEELPVPTHALTPAFAQEPVAAEWLEKSMEIFNEDWYGLLSPEVAEKKLNNVKKEAREAYFVNLGHIPKDIEGAFGDSIRTVIYPHLPSNPLTKYAHRAVGTAGQFAPIKYVLAGFILFIAFRLPVDPVFVIEVPIAKQPVKQCNRGIYDLDLYVNWEDRLL
ncbi:hypothetical protein B0T26DRAFT_671971 [Lasiosphaeria miniovina]|uniref:Myb/SANT-like domain-containing protein n=1 Tax=Lasiosphaeria miniovina TaxID=1954250 RepID=A0AA40B412_9PEZI|nr:uncharacterized protein B0T26DRAFT_671971 [Lasiosphaeria miniovina]KAK0727288.1 hypothetical protein B0T26DRAFT_671971 [Lasiosphaeria miniovina]